MHFWVFNAILSAQKNFTPNFFSPKIFLGEARREGVTQCYQAFLVSVSPGRASVCCSSRPGYSGHAASEYSRHTVSGRTCSGRPSLPASGRPNQWQRALRGSPCLGAPSDHSRTSVWEPERHSALPIRQWQWQWYGRQLHVSRILALELACSTVISEQRRKKRPWAGGGRFVKNGCFFAFYLISHVLSPVILDPTQNDEKTGGTSLPQLPSYHALWKEGWQVRGGWHPWGEVTSIKGVTIQRVGDICGGDMSVWGDYHMA